VEDRRLKRMAYGALALAAGLLIAAVVLFVARQYADLLIVLLMGWLLAFILNPLCSWVSRPHLPRRKRAEGAPAGRRLMPRGVAVILVYVGLVALAFAVVVLAVPPLVDQLQALVAELPEIAAQVDQAVAALVASLGLPVPTGGIPSAQTTLTVEIGRLIQQLISNLSGLVAGAAALITNLILILVFALYLNLGGPVLGARVIRLLPRRWWPTARVFMRELDRAVGGFLVGQTAYAAISAAIVAVAMLLFQVPLVGAATLLTFVLSLIPLFGSFLGIIPPVMAGLLVSVQVAVLLLVLLGGIQLVLTNAVMPRVFGASIRLEPIVVFLAIIFGIRIAGFWGAIFAIPVTSLAIGMLQYFRDRPRPAPQQQA
jgi:predicted PurR-regulated permease PerM